jgi:histidyl-tRNA synthetase
VTSYRAPKGTFDVLPPSSEQWRSAHREFDLLCGQFGYGHTLTPIFEDTEVFARGVGGDTEVVEKQMYTFEDKGGRSITLRPEATASVVRAVIQGGGVSGRFKGSYWGPMFRYERPQKGRTRQFYQAGVEYIGSDSPEADVEVVEFGFRMLERLGVPDVKVHLNSVGDPEDRADYREILRAYLVERKDDLSPDARRRIDTNPMRVLDSKADAAIVSDAPVPLDHLGDDTTLHFAHVKAGLESIGIPYIIETKLVRGLDYYNRTVWEYIPSGYDAAQSSVGGGGRYDGLFELLGGKPTPAVGLAMGVDRILLASADQPDRPRFDAFVIAASEADRIRARQLVSQLRARGLRAEMTDTHRAVKTQFREADRSEAIHAIVVGDEWTDGQVVVKQLQSGEQELVAVKEIEAWLRA